MTKENQSIDPVLDNDAGWEDPSIEIDNKEQKYCCDAEKRRRIEALREARELAHELREFYDD